MARWIDQMAAAADKAARAVWSGRGEELIHLPRGTEVPKSRESGGDTFISAIDLLRALVAEHERDNATDEEYEPVDIILPPKEIR